MAGVVLVGRGRKIHGLVHGSGEAEVESRAEAGARREQAQAAVGDRAAMAAIVSHELRTPVSAILAGAHVIRDGKSPEHRQETADLIIDAGRLMTGMLNDLLDHSKMEAGAMAMESRDFELGDLMRDTVRFWAAPAADKGLTLDMSGVDSEAVWLRGDPYRLRQIINNLVSNAIKFTPEDGAVHVGLEEAPEGGLTLYVRDNGAGIPSEKLKEVMEPFAQVGDTTSREHGGTGLGLSITRSLAEMHGGSLTLESELGRGTRVAVNLPASRLIPPSQTPKIGTAAIG